MAKKTRNMGIIHQSFRSHKNPRNSRMIDALDASLQPFATLAPPSQIVGT